MAQLTDTHDASLRALHGNSALDNAAVVIKAASSAIFKTGAAATRYIIDGIFGTSVGAATDIVLSGILAQTVPAGYSCAYVLGVVTAGTTLAYAGVPYKAEVKDGVTYYRKYDCSGSVPRPFGNLSLYTSDMLPAIPDVGFAPFATAAVTTATNPFIPGTTALDATGVTFSIKNVALLPAATNL